MYQLFPIDTFLVSYYIYGRHIRYGLPLVGWLPGGGGGGGGGGGHSHQLPYGGVPLYRVDFERPVSLR